MAPPDPLSGMQMQRAIMAALRAQRLPEAADLALAAEARWSSDPDLAYWSGRALLSAGRPDAAFRAMATGFAERAPTASDAWSRFVATARAAGRRSSAARIVAAAADRAPDDPRVALLAAVLAVETRHPAARDHTLRALTLNPEDPLAHRLAGRAAWLRGNLDDAVAALRRAQALRPDDAATGALLADLLLDQDDPVEAARVLAGIVARSSTRVRLMHAAAVRRTGADATPLFDLALREMEAKLPPSLAEGLAAPAGSSRSIRREWLDWAWRLRRVDADRADWEVRAEWGARAEDLLLHWMMAAPKRIDEMADRIAWRDPDALLQEAGPIVAATAHMGPLLAIPVGLRKLARPFAWIGSPPRWGDDALAASLISTSDMAPRQVTRRLLDALGGGALVMIAADGKARPHERSISLEGQSMPAVAFTAVMAHWARARSIFIAAEWDGDRILLTARRLPSRAVGEALDDHLAAWTDAYYGEVRRLLSGRPENLRFRGGFWQNVRDTEVSA